MLKLTESARPKARCAAHRVGENPGQVLVLFALFLVVLLGSAALAVDIGTWLVARRDFQAVADSAALAGGKFLTQPESASCTTVTKESCARSAAWRNLNTRLSLGLPDAGASFGAVNTSSAGQPVGGFTIWVSTPPNGAGVAYPGNLGASIHALFVRVEALRPTFFGRVLGLGDTKIGAWATTDTSSGRWAVITLRRGRGGSEIDSGPSDTQDIKIAGTTSKLTVRNGDIGGNWGMKIASGKVVVERPSAVYLIDYVSCGNSCWTSGDLIDENQNPLANSYPPTGAKKLQRFVEDPNYAPPTGLSTNAPLGPVTGSPGIPVGDSAGAVDISTGSVSGATCAAGSPRIGPGWYSSIRVRNRNCLILDPTMRYADPSAPTTGASPVASTQLPGVFYVTGDIQVDQEALIVGDGVTVVIRPARYTGASQFSPNSQGVMDLNTGKAAAAPLILGAWTTKGQSSYAWVANASVPAGGSWVYQSSREANAKLYGRGLALYVLKPSQFDSGAAADANTNVIQVNAGAGLAWQGITYAPHDNVAIAGQPNHAGIGQLVTWTFTFNGGTDVLQTYDGPDEGVPYLVEPCTSGNGGSC